MLFDVDGTLVDSTYLHILAWWRAFREVGRTVPMAAIHRCIGMASERLVQELLGEAQPGVSELHSRQLEGLRGDMRAFEGAAELLRSVSKRGATVVLATSAKEEDLPSLLGTIGAEDAVDEVISSAKVERGKPAGDIFTLALKAAGLSADRAVVVGDTIWDIEAGRRIGLRCISVLTGGIGRRELEAEGSLAVYQDVSQLLARLDQSPIGSLLR